MNRYLYTPIIAFSIAAPSLWAQAPDTNTVEDSATPEAVETPAPTERDIRLAALRALDNSLNDELRELGKGTQSAEVFVQPVREQGPYGVVLMIPPDGLKPTTAAGIEPLRRYLPDRGWETWVLSLPRRPAVHALYLESSSEADASPETPAAPEPVDDPSASADAAPEEDTTDTSLDAEREQQASEWLQTASTTIVFAAGEARSATSQSMIMIAEGRSTAALLAALREDPELADGVILIDTPHYLHDDDAWPEEFTAPVIEILSPRQARESGHQRRQAAAGLPSYEQAVIEYDDAAGLSLQAPLVRRIRGWLKRLSEATPGED